MRTQNKKLLWLCGLALGLVVVALALGQAEAIGRLRSGKRSNSSGGADDRGEVTTRANELLSLDKRQLTKRIVIFENLYKCITEVLERVLSGVIKFPPSCCELPIFSFICKPQRRMSSQPEWL